MKNPFKNSLGASLIAAAFMPAAGNAWAATTQTVWSFDSAEAIASSSGASGAQAVVTPGKFSAGWLQANSLFGAATGIWDLGRQGTITVPNLAAILGDASVPREFSVRVIQWNDGGIYTVPAAVTVPGASCVSSSEAPLGPVGDGAAGATGWLVKETQWHADAGASLTSILVTAAYDGSLVDGLIIEAAAVSPGPLVLSIRPANGSVEIAWPETAGSTVLESTTTPADAESWTTVAAEPVVAGGEYHVTVPAADAVRFFRVRR